MPRRSSSTRFPEGGIVVGGGRLRHWRWDVRSASTQSLSTQPEHWYLIRAQIAGDAVASVAIQFADKSGRFFGQRAVDLVAAHSGAGDERLAWTQAPARARWMRLTLPPAPRNRASLSLLTLHAVAERDPKCHPGANVPRWSTYSPPFPIDAIVLPASLAELGRELTHATVEIARMPMSTRELAARVIGKAWILDPAWVAPIGITWADMEKIGSASWALIDLATTARLIRDAGLADAQVVTRRSRHGLMSARVEYAEVATCGFALMDVLPYGTYMSEGAAQQSGRMGESARQGSGFAMRVLRANRSWKRYAEESGFAMLLSSQTGREDQCNDVLSATLADGQGEILATDLPWLVARRLGTPIAPRLLRQLLQTHLAAPVEDAIQFWNRWDDTRIVVRDIADLARRYPPLRIVRFAAENGQAGMARLGLELDAAGQHGPTLMIQTGRIDNRDLHDGVPPEPMMIFMKWLAREVHEGTPRARRILRHASLLWQFDVSDGLKYATLYNAAPPRSATHVLHLRRDSLPVRLGILGDGSLEFQAALTERLAGWLEKYSH